MPVGTESWRRMEAMIFGPDLNVVVIILLILLGALIYPVVDAASRTSSSGSHFTHNPVLR